MIKSVLVLFSLFSISPFFSQIKNNINPEYSYELSNSVGLDIDKTKPVLYLNVLKKVTRDLSLGFRAGTYTYHERLIPKLQEEFMPQYNRLPPGFYRVEFYDIKVKGITYVVSLEGKYNLSKRFSAGLCAGFKNYLDAGYSASFTFSKSGSWTPLEIMLERADETGDDKVVSRLYVSVNAQYNAGRFTFGVFGDNIYSLGCTLGILF